MIIELNIDSGRLMLKTTVAPKFTELQSAALDQLASTIKATVQTFRGGGDIGGRCEEWAATISSNPGLSLKWIVAEIRDHGFDVSIK